MTTVLRWRFLFLGVAIILSFYLVFHFFSIHSVKAPKNMVWIPGGEFMMGSDSNLAKPNEKPAHKVHVDGFWMDQTDVTNAQFAEFVKATGYVTTAEKRPDWE